MTSPLHDFHDARMLRSVTPRPITPRRQLQPERSVCESSHVRAGHHHSHLRAHCFVHCVPAAVRPVAAAVQRTLKTIRVLEYWYILCANMACTLLWLLPPWLLPSWRPVTTSRWRYIALLRWGESLLRIATGFLWATLKSARVGLGLAEVLLGVWLALLLVVWRCATTPIAAT